MYLNLRFFIKTGSIILFLLCSGIGGINIYCQSYTQYGASDNGNVFVKIQYLGDSTEFVKQTLNYGIQLNSQVPVKQFIIECLQLEDKKILSQIRFNVRKNDFPDTLCVSPRGDNFYIRFKNHFFFFNSYTGKLIRDYVYPSNQTLHYLSKRKDYNEREILSQKVIAFPGFDDLFVVRYSTMLIYYDSRTGNPLDTCTGFSRNSVFTQMQFTKGDQYLYVKDRRHRSYVWKVGQKKILTRQFADQMAFSLDNKHLYALRKQSKGFKLTTYSLLNGKSESVFRKGNILKYYPPPVRSDRIIITSFPKKSPKVRSTRLSPNGKYLLVGFEYDRLSDYYMIINTESYELISHFDEIKMRKKDRNLKTVLRNMML